MKPLKISPFVHGFTLIELAMVLLIVALLLGGMLLPLSAQQDIRNNSDTRKILADTRDALLGFAMANDRLPCPASATSNGIESFCDTGAGPCVVTPPLQYQSHGRCSHPYNGFVPAVTLGLAPVDVQGYLLDGWGGDAANRVRYAISKATAPAPPNAFTTTSGMKNTGITTLVPDLKICSTGVGMVNEGTPTATCAANTSLATDAAVAVVYSLGKNAGTGGASDDEKHNPNPSAAAVAADPAFVSAPQGPAFDDQLIWLSKNILLNRMVAAGRLP
ncbi:MAG: prepilin-type N-terminal cleavage/methylation domain-containing protein [Sulfuritalea sp.]|nr:prepilin-type N-terminal cleavage/methylation domain-containing protein [Sulfuritalea sp.]